MRDNTRIAICRGAFLALCVVPTLLTIGFIAFHWLTARSPATKAEWERELSQRLGVAVTIGSLSYPQPSVAELGGVRLADAETGLALGECRRVEIEPTPQQWQVTLVEPIVKRNALTALVQKIGDRLVSGAGRAPPIRCVAAQLTFQDDASAHSFVAVTAQVDNASAGPALKLCLALPHDEPSAIELGISRNRQITPPATQIEWSCPSQLPADLASSLVGDLSALGPQATLSGSGRMNVQDGKPSGEFSGEIADIDLAQLIGERFPHLLTGQAKLTLERAMIEGGHLTQARGTLVVAGGGRISRSLLAAAQEHLQLTADLPPEGTESITYRRLALGFELADTHLRLTGAADTGQPSVLVTQSAGPLLSAPKEHDVLVVALMRTLVPDSQVQVPATKQTAALLSLLPIPTVEPPHSVRRTSHTPTRLGPASPANRSANPIREKSLR